MMRYTRGGSPVDSAGTPAGLIRALGTRKRYTRGGSPVAHRTDDGRNKETSTRGSTGLCRNSCGTDPCSVKGGEA
ncbi:hypothetical protein P3T76_016454 [Phytophthora citrophthora]|uniref:Uncharacterized protein n=1 Tax=Phytophthora citrophthora TaxID=4793 RepID=A0AAD9FXY7_9STRA|nr:hypothetical protein P3T76_016454 [Phytophthora citrophthora]